MAPRRLPAVLVSVLVGILAVAAFVWLWLTRGPDSSPPVEQTQIGTDIPADEFEQRVRRYLLDNPEVLLEAMQHLEERQEQAAQDTVRTVLEEREDELLYDPDTPVGGNPDGDVTFVEFLDYNCPYCRRVASIVTEATAADPQLRIVYKEFPILGSGSVFASKAALAADRQGKYVEFHEALMQHRGAVDEEAVLATAQEVGLDVERLKDDIDAPDIAAAIERNIALAQDLYIRGTPAFIIGDRIIPGAVDLRTLQAAIQAARRRPSEDKPLRQ